MSSPRELAPDLHVIEHPLAMPGGIQIGTRSTVIRLSDRSVWLHSPGPLTPALREWFEKNGPPAAIVAPSLLHHGFVVENARAFPQARVYGPPGFEAKTGIAAALLDGTSTPWVNDLASRMVAGCPKMNELVFLHGRSRTLILTDLAFNFHEVAGFGTRLFLRLNGVLGKFRASRLGRSYYFEDHAALRASVEQILAWDFDRIVVAHGDVVERDGREIFRRGFDWLLV